MPIQKLKFLIPALTILLSIPVIQAQEHNEETLLKKIASLEKEILHKDQTLANFNLALIKKNEHIMKVEKQLNETKEHITRIKGNVSELDPAIKINLEDTSKVIYGFITVKEHGYIFSVDISKEYLTENYQDYISKSMLQKIAEIAEKRKETLAKAKRIMADANQALDQIKNMQDLNEKDELLLKHFKITTQMWSYLQQDHSRTKNDKIVHVMDELNKIRYQLKKI